jgi:hypothetical protein
MVTTRTDGDEARSVLADGLESLAYAIQAWKSDPTNEKRLRAARAELDAAERAFGAYDSALTAWAAGPSGGAPDA